MKQESAEFLCLMNPLQWLKAIYETFGTPYPRLSLVAVSILGAISFAAVWLFAAKQVEKDRHTSHAPSQISGPASTTGDRSPAVTGNGNDIKYDESSHHPEKKAEPPKKD
jgi:hypothetical protein